MRNHYDPDSNAYNLRLYPKIDHTIAVTAESMGRPISDYDAFKMMDTIITKEYFTAPPIKREYAFKRRGKQTLHEQGVVASSATLRLGAGCSSSYKVHAVIKQLSIYGLLKYEITNPAQEYAATVMYKRLEATEKGKLFHTQYLELLKMVDYFKGLEWPDGDNRRKRGKKERGAKKD